MIEKASQNTINDLLKKLNYESTQPWRIKDEKLFRQFEFSNFIYAFGFMTKVAILAEKQNHHPEWSNCYNKVFIYLTTYEVGGISNKDFDLALQISKI